MIEKLQYAFATASELLCYGRQDLKNAAMAGAVDTLLISGDAWLTSVEDETVVLTKRHGGRVVRACSPHYELDLLGVCALLRFPMREESDEHEIKAVEEQEAASSSSEPTCACSPPPSVRRTLTFFAPCDALVHPTEGPNPAGAADELQLLTAMFGEDRKLRMCRPDGSHLLLQVDAVEHDACYVILEVILPPCYPEESPIVTAPYGVLPSGRTLSSLQMEACAKQCLDCAGALTDESAPALYSMYEAAREWLSTTAAT